MNAAALASDRMAGPPRRFEAIAPTSLAWSTVREALLGLPALNGRRQ